VAVHQVRFVTSEGIRTFDVREGATLLHAALRARLPVARSCRGVAVCAACRLTVLEGAERLAPPPTAEAALAARERLGPGERYACQARVRGPCTVTAAYW
jgi:2Fe-2S ferredoxin